MTGEDLAGFGADRDTFQAKGAFGRIAGELACGVDCADRAGTGAPLALGADVADLSAQLSGLAYQSQ